LEFALLKCLSSDKLLRRSNQLIIQCQKWSSVSENLKDLIKKTIVIDYDERLTLNQVEHHPFFKNEEPPQRTGSLRNLINRLFSSDKNGKNENERMDSC
jgi:serine/threonine protein kinase